MAGREERLCAIAEVVAIVLCMASGLYLQTLQLRLWPNLAASLAILAAYFALLIRLRRRREGLRQARWDAVGRPVGAIWRGLFVEEGLDAVIADVDPHARGAVRVTPRRLERWSPGESRIGGEPDLPAGTDWPHHNGKPLFFLAQLDLEEVADALPASPLPRTGRLWFFYDFHDIHDGPAAVLFDSSNAPVEPAPVPAGMPEKVRSRPFAVTLEGFEDIPDRREPWLRPRLKRRGSAYLDVASYLAFGRGKAAHKLLGYATPLYGMMEAQCEHLRGAVRRALEGEHRQRPEVEPAAGRWRLLLQMQVGPRHAIDWSHGDARAYFWIDEEDLHSARFDRTLVILEVAP